MTSDPERLLAAGDTASTLSRELLTSLEPVEPPTGAREAAWNGITRQVALLGAASVGVSVTAAASASATKGGTSLFGLKAITLLKIAAGVGALSAGVAAVGSRTQAPALPVEPTRAVPVVLQPGPPPHAPAQSKGRAGEPEERAAVPEAPQECLGAECDVAKALQDGVSRPASDAERAGRLSRESALLVKARAALRTSNVAEASALLSRLETQFPRGVLAQEREVLRIELLHARGDRAAAAARARAFIAANPKSPHSAKLARFASAR